MRSTSALTCGAPSSCRALPPRRRRCRGDDGVGHQVDVLLDFLLGELAADQALDGIERVARVGDGLALGAGANEDLAVFLVGNDGRRGAGTLGVLDDARGVAFHDRDAGVGRAEVNADDLSHEVLLKKCLNALEFVDNPAPFKGAAGCELPRCADRDQRRAQHAVGDQIALLEHRHDGVRFLLGRHDRDGLVPMGVELGACAGVDLDNLVALQGLVSWRSVACTPSSTVSTLASGMAMAAVRLSATGSSMASAKPSTANLRAFATSSSARRRVFSTSALRAGRRRSSRPSAAAGWRARLLGRGGGGRFGCGGVLLRGGLVGRHGTKTGNPAPHGAGCHDFKRGFAGFLAPGRFVREADRLQPRGQQVHHHPGPG